MSANFSVGGLASGFDTNTMIDELLRLERIPLDRLEARREDEQARVQGFTDITTRLSGLRSSINAIDAQGDWSKFVTASSSNTSVLTATATGAATPGSLSFTVSQLAATHQVVGNDSFAESTSLVGTGSLTINVGGTDTTINTDGSTTLADLSSQIGAIDGVNANILKVADGDYRLVITSEDSGAAGTFTATPSGILAGGFATATTGQDAQITLGGSGVVISRSSNTITDLVSGLSIQLAGTGAVDVTVDRDEDAAVAAVQSFVDEVNATFDKIKELTAFGGIEEDSVNGVLMGNSTLRDLEIQLRSKFTEAINIPGGAFQSLSQIGIQTTQGGKLTLNESTLRNALGTDFDAVRDVFVQTATATDSRVTFLSSTDATVAGTYAVNITTAAEAATVTGSSTFKKADETVTITSDSGEFSPVVITFDKNVQTTTALAVQHFNDELAAAGVTTITASDDGADTIILTESRYGTGFDFTVTSDGNKILGSTSPATSAGRDVAGTIGGEGPFTGVGRTLTATTGDPIGLSLQIDGGASGDLGSITFAAGLTGTLESFLEIFDGANGRLKSAKDTHEANIDLYDERIEAMEYRLEQREITLIRQFTAMESAISALQTQLAQFNAQIAGIVGQQQG